MPLGVGFDHVEKKELTGIFDSDTLSHIKNIAIDLVNGVDDWFAGVGFSVRLPN